MKQLLLTTILLCLSTLPGFAQQMTDYEAVTNFIVNLSRDKGMSNGINLEYVNRGNYDLVVIDESHNFRNGGKITAGENDENPRGNRYLRFMKTERI